MRQLHQLTLPALLRLYAFICIQVSNPSPLVFVPHLNLEIPTANNHGAEGTDERVPVTPPYLELIICSFLSFKRTCFMVELGASLSDASCSLVISPALKPEDVLPRLPGSLPLMRLKNSASLVHKAPESVLPLWFC